MRRIVAGVSFVVVLVGALVIGNRLGGSLVERREYPQPRPPSDARAPSEPRLEPVAATPGAPVAEAPATPVPRASAEPAAAAPVEPAAAPVEPGAGSRLAIRRLLAAGAFDELNRVIEAKQVRAAADVRHEDELARVILTFDVADPAMTPQLDAWVAAQPKAWAPRLARAKHFHAVGFARRGTKWAKETSRKQMDGLNEYLRRAVADAEEALRLNEDVVETYGVFIRAADDPAVCLAWGERALAIEPASARTYFAIASCLLPRWGGSYPALEALAAKARPMVTRNPALAALAGFVDWDRGRLVADNDLDQAIALYDSALQAGEYYEFYKSRAKAHRKLKRYSDALADIANALALRPEDPDLLTARAMVFTRLGRHRDSLADVRLAAELDPSNDDLAWFRQNERKHALGSVRHFFDSQNPNGAIERLNAALAIKGDDAELRYWRGRAYIRQQRLKEARADMEAAIRLDPRHFEAYRNLDWLLARERRWAEIITRWNAYLALEPLSGDAYLERAGTHHHAGNETAARADLKKACQLGVQKACDIQARQR